MLWMQPYDTQHIQEHLDTSSPFNFSKEDEEAAMKSLSNFIGLVDE